MVDFDPVRCRVNPLFGVSSVEPDELQTVDQATAVTQCPAPAPDELQTVDQATAVTQFPAPAPDELQTVDQAAVAQCHAPAITTPKLEKLGNEDMVKMP